MRRFALILIAASFVSSTASAADSLEYAAMDEYSDVCLSAPHSNASMQSRFSELGWSETQDEDIADLNRIDDIFDDVDVPTAYEVELDNGGFWFGGVGSMVLSKIPASYCSITLYGNDVDRDAIRADFDRLHSEDSNPSVEEANGELRIIEEVFGGRGAAIHQQVAVPGEDGMVMFRTVLIMPKS